jgi:hypothetical protein
MPSRAPARFAGGWASRPDRDSPSIDRFKTARRRLLLPQYTSGKRKLASLAAMMKSQFMAISPPEPTVCPCTSVITGRVQRSIME